MYTIGINISFLRKPYTGIGQVTTHVLHELLSRKEYVIGGRKVPQEEVLFYGYSDSNEVFDLPSRIILRRPSLSYSRDDIVRKWLFERIALPRSAREDRLDAFISPYQSATVFGRWNKTHHVMVVHDLIPEILPEYNKTFRKKLSWKSVKHGILRADRIVAVSQYTEKDIIKHLGIRSNRISVAPIDVDPGFSLAIAKDQLSSVMRHHGLSSGYFFCSGGLEKRKNVANVIYAYKQLLKEKGDANVIPDLVISGMLMPELAPLITDVETLVRKCNLTKRVHVLGAVPQHDMLALYQGALASLFVSEYEGFGMPVLEAMRSGTPVVATKKTSLPEVGGDAVLYCDGTVQDIVRAMKEMTENDVMRKELRRRGSLRSKLFSWESFVNTLLGNISLREK